ncbi:MAG: THUMP domain-containing protein [Cyclobacteriaceae bacterium]|nr:THUMP domain-containing protein [Cyclobacteriaceae bacterium]
MLYEKTDDILITCLPELGKVLASEVKDMNFPVVEEKSKYVKTRGTMLDVYRMNLWLRTASHVYFRLTSFRARDAEELYAAVLNIPWEEIMDSSIYFSVHSYVDNDTINDNRYANLKVKDAIVDRMVDKTGKRPDSGPEKTMASFYLFWVDKEATIYIDTSGQTLSRRGYRVTTVPAPMAESLAAAIVLISEWDKKTPFINPMCGSGTIAIEAALYSHRLPPSPGRTNYGFMHIKGFDKEKWVALLEEAKLLATHENSPLIRATDHSRQAMVATRNNAEKAGVLEFMEIKKCDFEDTAIPEIPGIIMLNPEYGERIGEINELEITYNRIGNFLKQQCKDYKGYIYTGNPLLAKKIGLKTSRRMIFFNAKIECRLLEYEVYSGTKKQPKMD